MILLRKAANYSPGMTNRMGKRSMVTDAKKRSVDDIITVNNSSNNNNNSNGWPKQDSKRNKPKNRNKNNNNKKLNNDIQKPSLSLLQLNNYFGRGETLQNFVHFVNYWWFRYLMVTELYMVERWERIVIRKCDPFF